jgi:chemotaxis protein MotB
MRTTILFTLLYSSLLFIACGKKELKADVAAKQAQITQLEKQVETLQSTTGSLLDRMADLSVVNKEGAESIKHSLETLSKQYGFIEDLTQKIQTKDSINLALVMNLKRSLTDVNDEDVKIEIREGVVYVSISDKMLFASGSARINKTADRVLGKLANVLNNNQDLGIVVEGHTDNVPMGGDCVADNWDLSVLRATSVVRAMTKQYGVAPERLTASGHGEFMPKQDNSSAEGRAANRRTEIIIAPRLDQFFKMVEPEGVVN